MSQDSYPIDRNAALGAAAGVDSANPTELAGLLFEHMQGQINFADTKAQLTLAADALLAATIAPLGRGIALSLLDGSAPILTRALALVTALMIASLLISVYYSLIVARPVIRVKGALKSSFYFGDIVAQEEAGYIQNFMAKTPDDLKKEMLAQVYAKALIAQRKFTASRHSLNFLVGALVLWAGAQVMLAFIK